MFISDNRVTRNMPRFPDFKYNVLIIYIFFTQKEMESIVATLHKI